MMPICNGGLTDCPNTAVFLGPHEQPVLCEEHFAALLDRIHQFMQRRKDPLQPKPNANYEVENAEIEGVLTDIGGKIGSVLPKGWGFTLAIASYGENGSTFYISNVERSGSIKMLQELQLKLAEHAEKQGDAS